MFKETFDSVLNAIKARISSPIFGSFIVSWCVWNSPFLFIVMFGEGVEKRMDLINKYMHYSCLSTWGYKIIFPAASTAAYIWLYPLVKKPVYRYIRQKHEELQEVKHAFDKTIRLTQEESDRIRQEMHDMRTTHKTVVRGLSEEIHDLTNQLRKTQQQSMSSQTVMVAQDPNTDTVNVDGIPVKKALLPRFIEILTQLSEKGSANINQVVPEDHIDKLNTEYLLDIMTSLDFATLTYDSLGSPYRYAIRPKGRSYLVNNV